MRVNRFLLAITVCAGLALVAGRADAGISPDSPLLDIDIGWSGDPNDPNANTCFLFAEGTDFGTGGRVVGLGTGGEIVVVNYFTIEPTSVSRSENKASVKEGTWSLLSASFGAVNVGPVQIEKCKVSGSVNASKGTGSVSADCKGDDVFSLLTANQLASLQTAFDGNKFVKVKVNTDAGKASIKIKCKGDLPLP